MSNCHCVSLFTTIATTLALVWHLLKHSMAEDVEVGVCSFHGPTIVGGTSDKIKLIQERLKVA